jgi:hypothetical protein
MKRRTLLIAGTAVLAAASEDSFSLPRGARPLTIASASNELQKLKRKLMKTLYCLPAAQVFEHLTQGVEFSLAT